MMADSNQRISVVIPAYNEAESIGPLLDRVRALPGADGWEIIVVDDGSRDDTAQVAESHGARVVRHRYNLGNGASVKSGGNAATGDVLVFLDGDGQHPPEAIPRLLEKMDEYDMAVGARTRDSNVSRFRSLGNRALVAVAQYLAGRTIDDLTSGFRAVKKTRFDEFSHLFPLRYSYPTTITMAMFAAGYFVAYVPMDEIGRRTTGSSNIRPFQDGVRFLNIILRIVVLFNPMKVFLPLALALFGLGGSIGAFDAVVNGRVEESTLLLLILGAFCLFFGLLADQISHVRRELHSLMKDNKR
jgi:glycosyltransferase involved in cell wall biosynthesis